MTPANDGRRETLRACTRDASTHTGLWLDKYLEILRGPLGDASDQSGEKLRKLLGEAATATTPEGYCSAERRRRAALETLTGGVEGGVTRLFTARARGRLLLGLGTQSIRETNIALLHTWGTPFIPGSALKGLASAAAHTFSKNALWKKPTLQGQDPQGAEHAMLFGDTKHAGFVVFHDAWWVPEPNEARMPLDLDIMTVHHPDYYRDSNTAPADWDEPNPVAFLTARGSYLVALTGPEAWVLRAGEWLALGLESLGIGAKTQAGYGRMSLTLERSQAEIERTALREQHKTRLHSLANLPANHKGAGTAPQHIKQLSDAIDAGVPAEDVYAIARNLFSRDPKFWRAWAKEAKRTDEQRRFLDVSEMLSERTGKKSP